MHVTTRFARSAYGGLLVAMLVVAGAGCAPTESESSDVAESLSADQVRARGVALDAELDETAGAVILPADRFIHTTNDMILLASAGSVEVSNCAAENGVVLPAVYPREDDVYYSEHYYGPWTVAQAERFGFVMPMTDADLRANGISQTVERPEESSEISESDASPRPDLSEADEDLVAECASNEAAQAYARVQSFGLGPWAEELAVASVSAREEQATKDALEELLQCYESNGLQPGVGEENAPWIPEGAEANVISEEQVQMALTVVECKQDIRFTERVAQVEAELQASVIVEYLDELLEHRRVLDEALASASELVSREFSGSSADTTS